MPYEVLDETGAALDAHLDVDGTEFIFHSRGGKRGESNARNLNYGPGLRLLLSRIGAAGLSLSGAWLDSDEVLHLARERRALLTEAELGSSPPDQFRIISSRMQAFGRAADAPYGGSRVKRVRLGVAGVLDEQQLAAVLGIRWSEATPVSRRRMPASAFEQVTPEHIWEAVQRLRSGETVHPFDDPREFEVVVEDGVRLAPKAVFGLAAAIALGVDLLPEHFTGGHRSQCHRAIEAAGYEIARRGSARHRSTIPTSLEDRAWTEGRPRLVSHLKRERAAGLSAAKKSRSLREHGRVFCERCGLDPVQAFGTPAGEACIEVHHSRTQIAQMGDGGCTSLDDVQCLCANCHRLVHALMKARAEAAG